MRQRESEGKRSHTYLSREKADTDSSMLTGLRSLSSRSGARSFLAPWEDSYLWSYAWQKKIACSVHLVLYSFEQHLILRA